MIKVTVQKEKSYLVSARSVSKSLAEFFALNGIASEAEASVVIVSAQTMLEFVEKHLHEKGREAESHPVLSFVQSEIEGPFQFPPDKVLHLGEIIVSFDHAKAEADRQGTTPESEVIELAQHGALHLLGIHHE